jgi:hypothetical protein
MVSGLDLQSLAILPTGPWGHIMRNITKKASCLFLV